MTDIYPREFRNWTPTTALSKLLVREAMLRDMQFEAIRDRIFQQLRLRANVHARPDAWRQHRDAIFAKMDADTNLSDEDKKRLRAEFGGQIEGGIDIRALGGEVKKTVEKIGPTDIGKMNSKPLTKKQIDHITRDHALTLIEIERGRLKEVAPVVERWRRTLPRQIDSRGSDCITAKLMREVIEAYDAAKAV